MHAFASRVGRRSVARTIFTLATAAALGACADETTAPAPHAPSRSAASITGSTAAPSPEYTTSVDLGVGGVVTLSPYAGALVRVALTCSTNQLVDLVVDLEQELKEEGGLKSLVKGSSGVIPGVECGPATGPYTVAIFPSVRASFLTGRGTARARVTSTQPGVEPADVTRRVRMIPE
jgi:hypothetical protein